MARELGFQPVFVIADTANFSPPNAAYCDQVTQQYGLTMPVLYDAQGLFQTRFGVASNSVNVVVDAEGHITFKSQWDGTGAMGNVLGGLAD